MVEYSAVKFWADLDRAGHLYFFLSPDPPVVGACLGGNPDMNHPWIASYLSQEPGRVPKLIEAHGGGQFT